MRTIVNSEGNNEFSKNKGTICKITNIDTKSKKQNYQMWKAILVFIDLKIIKISKCESSVY